MNNTTSTPESSNRGLFGLLAVIVVVAGIVAAVYMTQHNNVPDEVTIDSTETVTPMSDTMDTATDTDGAMTTTTPDTATTNTMDGTQTDTQTTSTQTEPMN